MRRITNTIKVSFYIPKEWHDEMKKLAEETKASVSYHYRIAVKEYIERHRVRSE